MTNITVSKTGEEIVKTIIDKAVINFAHIEINESIWLYRYKAASKGRTPAEAEEIIRADREAYNQAQTRRKVAHNVYAGMLEDILGRDEQFPRKYADEIERLASERPEVGEWEKDPESKLAEIEMWHMGNPGLIYE